MDVWAEEGAPPKPQNSRHKVARGTFFVMDGRFMFVDKGILQKGLQKLRAEGF